MESSTDRNLVGRRVPTPQDDLFLYGTAFMAIVDGRIERIAPDEVAIRTDGDGNILGYERRTSDGARTDLDVRAHWLTRGNGLVEQILPPAQRLLDSPEIRRRVDELPDGSLTIGPDAEPV